MSTYNGEKYLDEQIKSLIVQEGVQVQILVRDDGSSDNTISKLKKWEHKGILSWYAGENLKPARSFMDLIKKVPKSDYYAFCDQDDVWDKDKLIWAVKKMERFDYCKPSLYFSNTRLVDSNLTPINTKKKAKPKITLGSALLINSVTGCTEVFNHALLDVLRYYENKNIYMHDGWSYRVCMAVEGNVVFDENPHISYRQHENNVVGGKSNIYKKYKRRFKNVITERSRIRENDAMELIKGYSDIISQDNMKKIKEVAFYRKNFKNKVELLFDKEIKTNSFEYNFAFVCAVLFDAL
jgi:rhamnosyltransferase